jgi:hypothetical protein
VNAEQRGKADVDVNVRGLGVDRVAKDVVDDAHDDYSLTGYLWVTYFQ